MFFRFSAFFILSLVQPQLQLQSVTLHQTKGALFATKSYNPIEVVDFDAGSNSCSGCCCSCRRWSVMVMNVNLTSIRLVACWQTLVAAFQEAALALLKAAEAMSSWVGKGPGIEDPFAYE